MLTKLKIIPAPQGCQVSRRHRSGEMRTRIATWWVVWFCDASKQVWSEPCTSLKLKRPESMREGFAGFVIPGVPLDLFM